MKKLSVMLLGVFPMLLAAVAVNAEEAKDAKVTYSVVEKVDIAKKTTFDSITSDQLKDAMDEVKLDDMNFNKAMSAAEKKWKEDKELKNYPFPKNNMAAPKITVVGTFDTLDKAREKESSLSKKDGDKDSGKSSKVTSKRKKNTNNKHKKEADNKKENKLEPDELLDKAVSMVESELKDLRTAKPAAGAAAAPAGN